MCYVVAQLSVLEHTRKIKFNLYPNITKRSLYLDD